MRGTLAVAAREIERRWVLLAAALAAGLLPFTAPLVRSGTAAAEWRDAMAGLLAVGVGLGAAFFLGASVVGRDLAEGRLSFDFARPLGAPAIWAGRLAAALALCIGAMVLALLPTALLGLGILSPEVRPLVDDTALQVILAVLLLIPLGHALSVMVRSRSVWLAVDGVAVLAIAACVSFSENRLFPSSPWWIHATVLAPLVPVPLAALWLASALGMAYGRTDPQRSHRALSLALWVSLGAVALGFAGYVQWVISATPEDLATTRGYGATSGNWAAIHGESPGRGIYAPAFLVDLGSGRFVRLGSELAIGGPAAFSGDGRRAAWLQRDENGNEIRTLDLATPGTMPRSTRITFSRSYLDLVLSEHGELLAARDGDVVSVYELASGRILASGRLAGGNCSIIFVGDDRVRAACWAPTLSVHELDVPTRRLATTGRTDVQPIFATWTPDRERLLVHEIDGARDFVLLDGRSATLIARLPPPSPSSIRPWGLLADGRVVLAGETSEGGRLLLFTRNGTEERSLDLPGLPVGFIGGEVAPGRLAIVSGRRGDSEDWPRRLVLVDLESGNTQVVEEGMTPVAGPPVFTLPAAEPGSAATRLFRSGDTLFALDPSTATWARVAGPKISD